jgi:hypothetical protein
MIIARPHLTHCDHRKELRGHQCSEGQTRRAHIHNLIPMFCVSRATCQIQANHPARLGPSQTQGSRRRRTSRQPPLWRSDSYAQIAKPRQRGPSAVVQPCQRFGAAPFPSMQRSISQLRKGRPSWFSPQNALSAGTFLPPFFVWMTSSSARAPGSVAGI